MVRGPDELDKRPACTPPGCMYTCTPRKWMGTLCVKNYLIISILGEDRPGLIVELSQAILDCGCSILESRIMVLGKECSAILMVHGNWNTLAKLETQLAKLEQSLNLTIASKRTEDNNDKGDALPYGIEVVAMDQPGIVHSLADFFSSRRVNIEDLATHSYQATHTNTLMFSVNVTISIPANMPIALFREEFMDLCDELNLDAIMEPVKG